MSISNDLVKQFVQITKDNSPVKTESTVYGTAVEYNGQMYVQIDGSDLITPVETTTELKSGERVTVMIKDHNATVTGNLTNPAAGKNTVANIQGNLNDIGTQITEFEVVIADKVSTKDFEANNAAINNLLVGKADINELNAVSATVRNLEAENANIQTLIADKANISDLTAANAKIDDLYASKADITELNAATADINDLNANLGKISTLIGGDANIDNVQSIILTADNTTIDNALIKNAMIDTISADKITSGTVDTNKVNIVSEDGGIVIAGSTQQFKDETGTVRVQIGKDAQGNFTFCLFSQNGTGVLLDETGIKAGAVPDGLIVNNMVADNANISGTKLDISSVITQINGSSTSINSSVIKFDDTGQSLLVAFNSLKETVSSIEELTINGDLAGVMEQVKTNTTKLEVVQGSIETLVSNTTITKENGQVVQLKDDYSSTKQTVNEISTKIGTLETNYKKTLKSSSVQYYLSTSLTSLSGGSWQDTAPEWTQGKYMWQRMKYTYTDNSVTYGTASCVAGAKGDTGEQGPQGPQGSKGDTGNSGVGVSKITNYYLAINSATGVTNTMTGWTTTIQNVSSDKKYLWNYEKVDYTNNTSTKTDPCIIGTYGDTGATGKGIQLITEYYATSTTKESLPTSWSTTVPTLTATNKYLWNYEKITYTDNSNVDTPKVIIGVYGDKGDTGAQGPKGDKGDTGPQGVQGPAGKDGKAYYTWIKYADSSTGSGMSNDPTGKTYIGFAYNKTTSTESNTASDYTWSLIKGEKGDTGVQGPAGKNGATTYTWIKYSDNADGTGLYDTPKSTTKYIGIATNKTTATESTTKTDYTWSLFKGDKGDKGAKGDKGDTGPQGVQGPAGNDGKTYYTWIKYADSSTGSGMSNDPTGKTYIGFAYNKTTSTESNTASDYTWSLIKGDKGDTGVQGPAGKNGTTTYTWIKYSDNADGTGLYDTPKSTTKYIGIATNKTTKTESTTNTDYTWSLFKGDTGAQGPQGEKGDTGSQGPKGDKGATGEKGQSLTSSTPQWYLSTSNTTQTGGSWQDTMPHVTTGKYIWQRFKNVWANPTATTYTTPVLEQIAESVKEVTDKQAEYKQTLDEVSSTLTQTTTTANAAKTQASTNKQTIDSMSTTLTSTTNTANDALNKATKAQQNLDGFKTTVSETYTTKTDFNNLSIGGRNFLIDTKKPKTYTLDTSTSTSNHLTKDPYKTYNHNQLSSYGFKVGDKITVSYDWKVTNVTTYGSFITELVSYANNTSTYVGNFNNKKTVTSSETSGRIETTISLTEQMLTANKLRIRTDSAKWTFTISNVKLEKGNRVTSWTPAPEDIDDKFTKYSTTEQMNSAIDQKANEITTSVSSTYTTKTDFNKLTIGGRNLAQKTSSEYSPSFSKFSGNQNECANVGKVLTDGLAVGDTVTVRIVYNYTDIVPADGQTATCRIQGSGDVTSWKSGSFNNSSSLTISGSGEHIFNYSFTIKADHLKNSRWNVDIRHDYVQSGTVKWKMFKVEKGNKATDWTPAPEDIDNKFTNYSTTEQMNSAITQKANEITSSVSNTYVSKTDANNTYATKSLVTQTAKDVRFEFQQAGGFPNLVANGSPTQTNDNNWWYWNASKYTGDNNYTELGFYSKNTSDNSCCIGTQLMVVSPGKTYSISFWAYCEPNVVNPHVIAKCGDSNFENLQYPKLCNLKLGNANDKKWYKYKINWTAPSGITRMQLCFHQENHTQNANYVTRIDQVMVIEGKDIFPTKWYPRFEEVESNTTSIDVNGVNVRHSSGARTNLNSRALNFYNPSGVLYAQVDGGKYHFWNDSTYVGFLGHTAWANTNERVLTINADYNQTVSLTGKVNSSDTNYQVWVVASPSEKTISGSVFHQGVTLIKPHTGGIFKFYGSSAHTDTYPGMIYATTDGYLCVKGDNHVELSIQVGNTGYNGLVITEIGENPYKKLDIWGRLDMHWWEIYNTNIVNNVSATSAQTYALRTASTNEETYSDPTRKTITDIFSVQSPTEGDIRWSDRQTYFTSEVETGVYECYVEIPWWIAQNLENDYHVNITCTNGFYQYYVSERDPYYFIVRSDKDSMGFTFELCGKLLDNNTTANNGSVAGDQYLGHEIREDEEPLIVKDDGGSILENNTDTVINN